MFESSRYLHVLLLAFYPGICVTRFVLFNAITNDAGLILSSLRLQKRSGGSRSRSSQHSTKKAGQSRISNREIMHVAKGGHKGDMALLSANHVMNGPRREKVLPVLVHGRMTLNHGSGRILTD